MYGETTRIHIHIVTNNVIFLINKTSSCKRNNPTPTWLYSVALDSAVESYKIFKAYEKKLQDLPYRSNGSNGWRKMKGCMLLNIVRPNTRVTAEAQEALAEYADDIPLLPERIHNRVAFKSSISQGLGVSEFEPRGKAAEEIQALYNVIFNNIK